MKIKYKGKYYVFGTLEFGEGTAHEDLWNQGYCVKLGKFLCVKYLVFFKD